MATAVLGISGMATAEVLEVTPTDAAVFTAEGTGVTTVVLRFDLSGMSEGEGRVIDEALLDWPLTGLSNESRYSMEAFPVTASWSSEGVSAQSPPTVGETRCAEWELEPTEVSAQGGALVRLDLKALVQDWLGGQTTNYGIVVLLPGVSANGLAGQLQGARLSVRYGYR